MASAAGVAGVRATLDFLLREARDDENKLRSAFSALYRNLSQINLAEGRKLDDASLNEGRASDDDFQVGVLDDGDFVPLHPLQEGVALPWEREQLPFEGWLRGTAFMELREAAIRIFHGQLNAHRLEARWIRMYVYDPRQPIGFQLQFVGGNLWQRIWGLAGLDTAQVKSWRICPGCNTIFYPKRSDQFYCSSREQVLASKRNYINARRQQERVNKLLALHTGMRPSEQYGLTWDRVDLVRNFLTLLKTKTGKVRHIPLNSVAVAAFKVLQKRAPKHAVRVFLNVHKEPLTEYKHWFEPAVTEAGLEDFTWYCLRHTFASRLAMAGVDLRTIADLMGHQTIQMTMRYAHFAPAHQRSAVEQLVTMQKATVPRKARAVKAGSGAPAAPSATRSATTGKPVHGGPMSPYNNYCAMKALGGGPAGI